MSPWFNTDTVAVNVSPRTGTAGLTASVVTAKSGFIAPAGCPNEEAHAPTKQAVNIQNLFMVMVISIPAWSRRIPPRFGKIQSFTVSETLKRPLE